MLRTLHWIIFNYNVKHPNRRTNSKIKRRRQMGTSYLLCSAQYHETKTTTSCKWVYMKDQIFKPRIQIWRYYRSSQLYTQLKQLWNYSLKKLIQAWTGLEPMTYLLYQLSYQAIWEVVMLWVCNIPVSGKETSEYMKDHIRLIKHMV